MIYQEKINFDTKGRGLINITHHISQIVENQNIKNGLCNVFLHHTSASLILCENFDIKVQEDLERFMSRLVIDGDPLFKHIEEGPDDMPSHVRAVLTSNSITIPITDSQLALGRWQGLYLWEHRLKPHHRSITVTVYS